MTIKETINGAEMKWRIFSENTCVRFLLWL
jgi:hypothetical protein